MNNYNYIILRNGFGNRMFDVIIALYVYYKTKKKLCGIIKHTKHNSENIFDLFPFLKKKFDVINIDKINIDNLKNLDCTKFEFIKNYNKLDNVIINKNWICYKYVFRIYNELPKDLKECFKINENIIDKNIKKKVNDKDFCAIHIRYGDKLKLSIDKEKNIQFKFLIYTPKYYIKMINIFLKKNKKVYILTDDPIIIKKYILNDFINNKNVELIDTDWINSFYILYKCTFLVMSLSTFSMFAAFINKNLKKAYIIIRPKDISFQYNDLLEEKVIEDTNWIKFEKKKYILNYDLQLMKEMQQYKWDFKDGRLN